MILFTGPPAEAAAQLIAHLTAKGILTEDDELETIYPFIHALGEVPLAIVIVATETGLSYNADLVATQPGSAQKTLSL